MVQERGLQLTFTPKTGVTLAENDQVSLSGSKEVTKSSNGNPLALGRVIVDATGVVNNSKVTVRTDYGSLINYVAGEAISAGPVILGADGKVYEWHRNTANGGATITIAGGNAAGTTGNKITIDGVDITFNTANGDTPTVTATAITALINDNIELINKGLFATSSGAVVTVSAPGKTGNGMTMAKTIDAGETQTYTIPATIASGVGYIDAALHGLAIETKAITETVQVLVKE